MTTVWDRRRLLAWEPADPEVVARAERQKETALLGFGLGLSAVASWLYTKCHHHIPTTAVPTAAVTVTADGGCALLFNPHFFAELDPDGIRFVLFHEARHLMHRHLHVDEALRGDEVFGVAAEVSINHVAFVRLSRSTLPVRRDTGEAVGVHPREVFTEYEKDLRDQGKEPVSYKEFVDTDLSVYRELKRMRNPVTAARCVQLADVGDLADRVLREVLEAAVRGSSVAKAELLALVDRAADGSEHQQRYWDSLGLGRLRGETVRTRRVDWWQRWLVDVLASKLVEAERLVYPKRQGAILLALGLEPVLQRRGPQRQKVVLIALDTSGSMPDAVVEWLTTLVGQTDGVEAHWVSFDGVVAPFQPGERVVGGGGTDFGNVVEYAEGRLAVNGRRFEEIPDAVIMLTDGYAGHVTPAEPDKWIWLITDGGDDWPDRHRPAMACHRLSTGEGS